MYLFFFLQREKASACQSAVMSRPRFIACSVFWVSSVLVLVQPPRGAWGRGAARAWPGGQEGPALALAQAQSVWPVWSSPRPLFTYPPSSAGLALRTGIVSLVTHSHQTPLEMLEKVGSRDIFGFIPVVKHLVFVSRFAQTLGPWWKLPPGGRGWVGRIPASPPWLP